VTLRNADNANPAIVNARRSCVLGVVADRTTREIRGEQQCSTERALSSNLPHNRPFLGGTMSRANESRVLKHPGSTREAAMIESKISISDNNRRKLVELLNARLADTIDMQTQMKFAHWNVKGENFYQLHLLFDTIAEHMEDAVDLIAERITALGGRANGTARQVASASSLKEYDLDIVAGMDHVRTLLDRLAAVANASRGAISESDELEDRATSDLFTEVVRTADKDLYFLESHLHG
jgi:starvation-inducible DNA-binding protein